MRTGTHLHVSSFPAPVTGKIHDIDDEVRDEALSMESRHFYQDTDETNLRIGLIFRFH